jgi:hypothetical protein
MKKIIETKILQLMMRVSSLRAAPPVLFDAPRIQYLEAQIKILQDVLNEAK